MRNLVVLNKGQIVPESRTYPDLGVTEAVFDSVTDSITYVLANLQLEDGMVEVQQFMKTGETHVLALFPIRDPQDELLSFTHFVDTCQLIFVFARSGDIITATYDPLSPDPDTTVVEIVGTIDVGLSAARWSVDEETLCMVTSERNVILLSRQLEPVSERQLNPNDIKITDSKHVSVGWGKKETQFTGKGARAKERAKAEAAAASTDVENITKDPTVNEVERGTLSKWDSGNVQITWRGDCEYFAISTAEPVLVEDTQEMFDRRVVRVFNREGELDSVSEAVDGLEHSLAWKPQGLLIASTQRHIVYDEDMDDELEVLDLVFYERNGLRHGEFNTRLDPETENIEALHWSSNSEVLAFQLKDRVQLWTTKNYHWYLKQEIKVDEGVSFVKFHSEKPLHLMIGTNGGQIQVVDLAYQITTGPTHIGEDQGMVLVVDGSTAKVTPLLIANVPPPISFREFDVDGNINDLCVGRGNESFAVVTSNGDVQLATIDWTLKAKIPKLRAKIDRDLLCEVGEFAKQIALADKLLAVVVDSAAGSRIVLFDTLDMSNPVPITVHDVGSKVVLLKSQSDFLKLSFETIDGRVFQLDAESGPQECARFPQLCRDYELAVVHGRDDVDEETENKKIIAFGVSVNGKLFANDQQVASAVTSLNVTESHLLYTTAQLQLCFIHLNGSIDEMTQSMIVGEGADERVRQMERGSILISAMPSKYSVVLEAPRGNLETICPRIMVLSGVRKFILEVKYKEAFMACRTHRIDLDILHDYNPKLFFENLEKFVKQIKKVSHLDLFVSCLHEEDVAEVKYKDTTAAPANASKSLTGAFEQLLVQPTETTKPTTPTESKINRICSGILSVLLKPEYFDQYLQTIITAYACQKPANLTGALELISSFTDEDQIDQTVTHLCFLQDVNKLYNTSLSMYDVKLTLIIAQKSQKDPKEYLPFLQNLHIQTPLRKKFLIDDFLKNYELALGWLCEMGELAHEEFDEYVVTHDLYKTALATYRYDTERSNTILELYAENLHSQQNFSESALTYEYLSQWDLALENYILAKKWREALTIVEQLPEHKIRLNEVAEKLINSLTDDHKYRDAAEIEFYFLGNINEAVKLYCKNYCYEEAILLATKEQQPSLIESVVDVQLGEGFGTIAELLADCKSQLESQLRRLRELREKKQADPYAFYGVPGNDDLDTPDNVSIAASETSTTPSFFTRYTGKTSGTAKTGASRRSSKNRKREERKKAKGRKGTIYEEEYLIRSVGRLVERLDQTQADAVKLIEGLMRRRLKEQAYQIQKNWTELTSFLNENITEIHNMSERDRERIDDNGEVYMIPEIPAPKINEFPKKNILDF